jgi:hypothetical protein
MDTMADLISMEIKGGQGAVGLLTQSLPFFTHQHDGLSAER